jgi:hypothetical protein
MATKIAPPVSDNVEVKAVTLRLSPAAMAKIDHHQKITGLNRANTIDMIMGAGHAALAKDAPLCAKWVEYEAALAAELAKTPPKA